MADIQLTDSATFNALKAKVDARILADGRMTITPPVGDDYANPKTALSILGPQPGVLSAGGATDVGFLIHLDHGSISGMDIRSSGTGYNMRFLRSDGLLETYMGNGNNLITAKWIGIYADLYSDNLAAVGSFTHPAFAREYQPPTVLPHMFGIGADVNLAAVFRGNNSTDPKIFLICSPDKKGRRLDMANGEIRWPRADQQPFVGDIQSTSPAAMTSLALSDFPIVLETFNAAGAYGLRIKSTAVGTIGPGNLFFDSNAGIYGSDGQPLLRWESASNLRHGNAVDNCTYNAAGQHDFEIASVAKFRMDTNNFIPLADNVRDLGTSALRFNDIYVGNAPTVGSDERIKDDIEPISDAILDAWSTVEPRMFRFKQSKLEKGDNARTHFGYIAQDIIRAFKKHGLNAGDYGIVVFQKWDDTYVEEIADVVIPEETVLETVTWESRELIDPRTGKHISTEIEKATVIPEHTVRKKTGNMVKTLEAGELWSVRYEQCAVLNRALAMRDARRAKAK